MYESEGECFRIISSHALMYMHTHHKSSNNNTNDSNLTKLAVFQQLNNQC